MITKKKKKKKKEKKKEKVASRRSMGKPSQRAPEDAKIAPLDPPSGWGERIETGLTLRFRFSPMIRYLEVPHFARLLLDLQHLAIMTIALAEEALPPNDIVFDSYRQKHESMVEAGSTILGYRVATVDRIIQESPLVIDLSLKQLPKALWRPVAGTFKFLVERVFFGDLEREKRALDNERLREEIRRAKIENLGAAFDIGAKIPDPQLREQFLSSLASSIRPFEEEHPKIVEAQVFEDEKS
jgi:hypothetical protein